jgi:hypothetical protein
VKCSDPHDIKTECRVLETGTIIHEGIPPRAATINAFTRLAPLSGEEEESDLKKAIPSEEPCGLDLAFEITSVQD